MKCRELHLKLMKGVNLIRNPLELDKIAALFQYKRVQCACGKSFLQKCYRDEAPTQTQCEICSRNS